MMPSSPIIGQRSGTASPVYDMVKDKVIGELASRLGRPIPEFNKNKRGSTGECEVAVVLSPRVQRKDSRVTLTAAKPEENCCHEVKPLTAAQLRQAHLQPQSASAPNSPRLKRPQQQITITSSAVLKVTNNRAGSNTPTRGRSKSPAAVNRLAAPSPSRRSRPSPSPTRRSRPVQAIPPGGHTSVKMSTKRKSPGRTAVNPALNRSISADPRSKSGFNRSMSADPDLSNPAIQAKIGNRMTKTIDKQIGKCGVCAKPVTLEGCTAFGKVYHKECFKCCVCKRKIDGKFFEKNGKPYCAKDWEKVTEECCVCRQPIKGDCIESGKKFYHPGCMKCFVCGDALRGQYFTFEGEPICERDYKLRAEKCFDCGEPIIGTCYTLNDKNYCEEHYREKCDKCPRCDEQIIGHMVRTSTAAFHPGCFKCVECNKDLSHDQFIMDDQKRIYCPDDFAKKKAYRCSTCRRPIVPGEGQKTAPRLRALGKDYHPDCFKCEDCGMLLDAKVKGKECYPHKNHAFCLKCNRKKLSSDESSDDED